MEQTVIYGTPTFSRPFGFEVLDHVCAHGCQTRLDEQSGHTVGRWCRLPTRESAIRQCDICDKEYINKKNYQNPKYETICPSCVTKHGLEDS